MGDNERTGPQPASRLEEVHRCTSRHRAMPSCPAPARASAPSARSSGERPIRSRCREPAAAAGLRHAGRRAHRRRPGAAGEARPSGEAGRGATRRAHAPGRRCDARHVPVPLGEAAERDRRRRSAALRRRSVLPHGREALEGLRGPVAHDLRRRDARLRDDGVRAQRPALLGRRRQGAQAAREVEEVPLGAPRAGGHRAHGPGRARRRASVEGRRARHQRARAAVVAAQPAAERPAAAARGVDPRARGAHVRPGREAGAAQATLGQGRQQSAEARRIDGHCTVAAADRERHAAVSPALRASACVAAPPRAPGCRPSPLPCRCDARRMRWRRRSGRSSRER